jgi:thiamine pyrophosphate-dependent acetolactate synthase large subunit-like protein
VTGTDLANPDFTAHAPADGAHGEFVEAASAFPAAVARQSGPS